MTTISAGASGAKKSPIEVTLFFTRVFLYASKMTPRGCARAI